MNESELICQVFVRSVSGAIAIAVGTGLAYFIFVEEYLRRIEHYKQRLEVYKEVHKRATDLVVTIRILKKNPLWADRFGKEGLEFTSYVTGERLFMSHGVTEQCKQVVITIAQAQPEQPSDPSSPPHYPEARLFALERCFDDLLKVIKSEIQSTPFEGASSILRRLSKKMGL